MSITQDYYTLLEREAQRNNRYDWLLQYFKCPSSVFFREHLHPVQNAGDVSTARTRVVVADFPEVGRRGPVGLQKFEGDSNMIGLNQALGYRDPKMKGRLVLLVSISGVTDSDRKLQLHKSAKNPTTRVKDVKTHSPAPVLTWTRTAGLMGEHPIKRHITTLPDPEVVLAVANHLQPSPEELLLYLDQNAHLSYQSYTPSRPPPSHTYEKRSNTKYICLGIDQANHILATIEQPADGPWTVLILASEDNCLGIDFNEDASSLFQQPLASETPSATFKDNILALNSEGIAHIISNPLALVSLYSAGLISTFASHVQLCHRNWSVAYEPYAHTSVAFGYAYHRDAVRRLARQYGTHLRYINHTLLSLKRFTSFNQTSSDGIPTLQPLIRDFEHFANEIGEMKKDCHLFLEQQVSKLALQDARLQMREARDLKRISYLAFIFVPLSLTSSFFGMNVKELDSGPTPVWKFAVTAIAVLVTSGFVLWASRSGTVWAQRLYQRRWWKSKDLLPVQAPAQLDGPAPKSKRLLSFLLRESAVALDRSAGSVMPNYGKLPDNFYGSPASCVPSNLPGPPANYMDPAYTPNAIHPISGQ